MDDNFWSKKLVQCLKNSFGANSVIWFSNCTTKRRILVTRTFSPKEPHDARTFLGYPMPKGRVTSKHYKKMEDKIWGKYGR
jgi:hypothetical protein